MYHIEIESGSGHFSIKILSVIGGTRAWINRTFSLGPDGNAGISGQQLHDDGMNYEAQQRNSADQLTPAIEAREASF